LSLVVIAILMFSLNPSLAMLSLLPAPIILVMSAMHMRRTHKLYHRQWRRRSRVFALLANVIPGVRVVKAFAQEDRERGRFARRSEEYMRTSVDTYRTQRGFTFSTMFLMSLSYMAIWGYGGYLVVIGAPGATVGTLMAFMTFVMRFYNPLQNLARMSQQIQRAATSAQRVFEVLDAQPDVAELPHAKQMPPIRGTVEFKNVTFGYEPHTPVLKDLSFKVEPGEMIGLVGPSGAGKSTTINLICRFYDVTEGAIEIDGVDLRDVTLRGLRDQIGVVLQEPFLFHGTVAENIAYGNPSASREKIIEAARAANAHEFIMRFPDGYDTMVGERGQRLSGGERQRISIARAILKNPRLLILDEATASVDTETEEQIRQAIDRLVAGRTTFAIAHRFSTLQQADRLIVLDNGRLVEMGTHEELLAIEDGLFRRLCEKQAQMSRLVAVGG
jgi:ATP-binding cassette subfamily B protein